MRSRKIVAFIVDDNPGDRALIRRMLRDLQGWDFEVVEAWNLDDTLDRLRAGPVDVLLLDLNLPGSRGVDTVSKIRAVSLAVPIIVITGSEDQQTAADVVGKGAQGHLVKGKFNAPSLGRLIEQFLPDIAIAGVAETPVD